MEKVYRAPLILPSLRKARLLRGGHLKNLEE